MKIKPVLDTRMIGSNSDDLLFHVNNHVRTRLGDLFKSALRKQALEDSQPRSQENRCETFEPRSSSARGKRLKVVKEKDHVSCNLAKTIPVLDIVDKTRTTDDSELYAMWWDFNGDRSTVMPTVSIDISAKEKAERINRMRHSQANKASIKQLKAVGITPRAHKHGLGIIGKAPHHASPEFGDVIANNPQYKQELYDRYLMDRSIERLDYVYNYIIPTNTQSLASYPSADTDVDLEEMIKNLEIHIEAQPSVLVGPPVPSDTRTTTLVESEAQYERDQWTENWPIYPDLDLAIEEWTPAHQDIYQTVSDYFSQYRGTDTAKSIVRMKEVTDKRRENGFAYQHWLIKHRSSIKLRERVESSKLRVNPDHVMATGITVHPLYHNGMEAFANLRDYFNHRRIATYSFGVVNNDVYKTWYETSEEIVSRNLAEKAENAERIAGIRQGIEAAETEELADTIVDQVVAKHTDKSQLSYKQWNYMVASQFDKITTVSEDSQTPMTDAIFNKWAEERKGAEVVSLTDVRSKRAANVGSFLSKLDFNISDLTPEQKDSIRNTVLQALNEALG